MNRLLSCLLVASLAWYAWPQGHHHKKIKPPPSPPHQEAPCPEGQLRLATWNLHNFFDEHDDPNADQVFGHEQVEEKITAMSGILQSMDAEMVAVEEVENLPLLQRLARASGYRYAILVEGNDLQRGIDVGFLSRRRVEGYRTHRHDVLPYVEGGSRHAHYSRDCLEVHVPLGSQRLIVLCNHFKSKLGNQRTSASKRRAQAMGVRDLVAGLEKHYPGAMVAAAGDFNDESESWALEPLLQSGLFDPFLGMPVEQRYTLVHRGETETLDHILLNPAARQSFVAGSARVYREEPVRKWSDHCPILLELKT